MKIPGFVPRGTMSRRQTKQIQDSHVQIFKKLCFEFGLLIIQICFEVQIWPACRRQGLRM